MSGLRCKRCGAPTLLPYGDYCYGCTGATPLSCEHGNLKRSCSICERDEEIAALRARVAELEAAYSKRGAALRLAREHDIEWQDAVIAALQVDDPERVTSPCDVEALIGGLFSRAEQAESALAAARAELAQTEAAYETSHASRLHAERCLELVEAERDAARAEVERLRGALGSCINACYTLRGSYSADAWIEIQHARAALSPPTDPEAPQPQNPTATT